MTETKMHHHSRARRTIVMSETLGWFGAAVLIITYLMVSFEVLEVREITYHILIFAGSLGILNVSTAKHIRQSILVNSFWALFAAVALFKIILLVE